MSSGGGGDDGLGGGTLRSGINAGGNMLVGGGGNLGGGGRAIIGGFVLSTATRIVLPAADGTRERLDVSSAVVPEEINDSIEDFRLSETAVRRPVESRKTDVRGVDPGDGSPKRAPGDEGIPFDEGGGETNWN